MNSNKYTYTKTVSTANLIGENAHRTFLGLQAAYGFAQRGGVQFPDLAEIHSTRLVNDINILSSWENKQLIFSESIFSN